MSDCGLVFRREKKWINSEFRRIGANCNLTAAAPFNPVLLRSTIHPCLSLSPLIQWQLICVDTHQEGRKEGKKKNIKVIAIVNRIVNE